MKPLIALAFALSLVALAPAQEQPKAEPKPDVKKPEAKKVEPKKDDDKSEDEVDVQKTAERIAENAQKAGERLKEKDPGADTRKLQQEVIKGIDALLKKAQQPPPPSPPMPDMMPPMPPMMPPPKSDMPPPKSDMPPPKGSMPPPKGIGDMPPPMSPMPMGSTGQPPPKSASTGNSGRPERKPRRERKPQGDQPMPMGMNEPMPKGGPGGKEPMPGMPEPKEGPMAKTGDKPQGEPNDKFGKMSPKRQNDKLADLYKDVWGTLPDRMRQEMDRYYREQFMPRYSELLKQYYASLAEQKKKGDDR